LAVDMRYSLGRDEVSTSLSSSCKLSATISSHKPVGIMDEELLFGLEVLNEVLEVQMKSSGGRVYARQH